MTSIGSASLAQTPLAQARKTRPEDATAAAAVMPPVLADPAATGTEGSIETQSVLSSATARVGDQLQAQSDASRVQRAVDEAAPAAGESEDDTESDSTGESTAALPAGAARGGARTGSSTSTAGDTESADYIAEADTNSDKKVSEQERIAYEKKLAQQTEARTQSSGGAAKDQSQELREAYGLASEAASGVSETA